MSETLPNAAEIQAKLADVKKMNPAELMQKGMGALMGLTEELEGIHAGLTAVRSELREGMKAIYREQATQKTLLNQLAECVERSKHPKTPVQIHDVISG